MAAEGARTGTQAVDRALAVLEALAGAPAPVGVSEIAHRTELSVSTAHRLVRTLLKAGFVDQDPVTDRYQLGPALVPLGRSAEARLGLAHALPVLDDLARATGESVNLGQRLGNEVLVVLQVASSQSLRFDQRPGTRVPMHTSAMGKCLLAWDTEPDDAVDRLGDLAGLTERTITDRARLASELHDVRARGWAINDEERVAGVRALAVPVHDGAGHPIAAIAVQGPTVRLVPAHYDDVVRELHAAAARLTPLLATERR